MAYTLITGASGGLGEEFARLAAADGLSVILVARSKDKLSALAEELTKNCGVEAVAIPFDLSDAGAAEKLYMCVKNKGLEVETLINNAGFGDWCEFVEGDKDKQTEMIRLNVCALTELCRFFGADMKKAGRGKILNISSIAALIAGPYMATYYATKAYVLSFSQSLGAELKDFGVTVTALCPGPTDTGFKARANVGSPKMFKRMMSSKRVAKIGYRAMKRGKPVVYAGALTKLANVAARLFPRRMCTALCKKINRGRKV